MQDVFGGNSFALFQYHREIPEHLENFSLNHLLIFRKTVIIRTVVGKLMKEYPEKRGVKGVFIIQASASFFLYFLFYWETNCECKKVVCSSNTLSEGDLEIRTVCFECKATEERKIKQISSVVAEAMKLLSDKSYV